MFFLKMWVAETRSAQLGAYRGLPALPPDTIHKILSSVREHTDTPMPAAVSHEWNRLVDDMDGPTSSCSTPHQKVSVDVLRKDTNLTNCFRTKDAFQKFVKSVKESKPRVQTFQFHCQMNDIYTSNVIRLLHKFPNLKVLTLHEMDTKKSNPEAFVSALSDLKHLTSLDLSVLDSEHVKALEGELGNLKHLTSLALGFDGLDNKHVKALAGELSELKHLTSLDLHGLDNEYAKALADVLVLSDLTHLTTLKLSDNNLRSNGAEALAIPLSNLTGLTALDLSFNFVRAGAKALAGALSKLTGLTTLNLYSNVIGEGAGAAVALAGALS